jgi:protein gp37
VKNSNIEWTHHTFNPWWGCTKVSEGCRNCYAAKLAERTGRASWGPHEERVGASDAYWKEPLKWAAEARRDGVRRRVFCASMADVFEPREDLEAARARLVGLIHDTPELDWLLLTKRPEEVNLLWELACLRALTFTSPRNVWVGTSVESSAVESRVEALRSIPASVIPARVRFLSCEPLIGRVNPDVLNEGIDWVIVGGESGPGARPMHVEWVRELRDAAVARGIPFFFKQWGRWVDVGDAHELAERGIRPKAGRVVNLEGGHGFHGRVPRIMRPTTKARAGRLLDGRTWDEVPEHTPTGGES